MACSFASSRTTRSASSRSSSSSSSDSPKPARDELRRRDLASVRRAQRRDDDEDAVVGEPPAVAEGDVLHVPDAEPVDERDARVDAVDEASAAPRELDDGAVVGDEDPLLGNARLACELRVRREHAVLAVDRHHVARAQQREHRPQLLLARVAGDVHGRDLLVQHLGAGAGELVDRVVDAELVARNRLRGDDHRVARLDRERLVVAVGDARQRRHRLALAPRAEHEDAVRRQLRRLVRIHERVLRERDVPEVAGDVEVLAHRAADDGHLPPALDGDVRRLLHAMDVRRERGHEDAARRAAGRASGTPPRRGARSRCCRAARRSSSPRGGGRPRGCRSRRASRRPS